MRLQFIIRMVLGFFFPLVPVLAETIWLEGEEARQTNFTPGIAALSDGGAEELRVGCF